jgi:AraC family transcriptional regulator
MSVLVNPPASRLGFESAILSGRGHRYAVRDFPGPLSIKSVRKGAALWETSRGRFLLQPGSYLVVNEGHPYSLTIESATPVETFCVFFRRGLVEETRRCLVTADARLLDEPDSPSPRGAEFFEAARRDEGLVLPDLERMRAGLQRGDAHGLWLEQRVLALAAALLEAQTDADRRMARLPARRASTREELLRRLERGREFLVSQVAGRPTLERAARAACLSAYHFHRAFKRAFGETPHQYLTRLRLERARDLLRRTDIPVTSVCFEAGFESLGSFGTLFRKTFGLSPRRYRFAGKKQA